MSEMPQGAIKISWKPPARERSDRGGEGGFPPPTVWSFFVFQCGIVCSGAHFRGYFHIFLHIISVFNWVLGTYCHIVKKKKKKKKNSLFLEISGKYLCDVQKIGWRQIHFIFDIISLIPRLSHRLSYLTFRTISWSWNSSTNYFMARALRVRSESYESYVCRAKCRVCGTVKSELGQWIRIKIGRARLKHNLDLISIFHCHCPRAQFLAAHTAAHQS